MPLLNAFNPALQEKNIKKKKKKKVKLRFLKPV